MPNRLLAALCGLLALFAFAAPSVKPKIWILN